MLLEPRTRIARKKTERKPAPDFALEKAMQRLEIQEKKDAQQKKIEALIKERKIICSELPVIDEDIRKILLGWISRALADEERKSRTDQGRHYHVYKEQEGTCILHCSDGDLLMPCFVIAFDEEER